MGTGGSATCGFRGYGRVDRLGGDGSYRLPPRDGRCSGSEGMAGVCEMVWDAQGETTTVRPVFRASGRMKLLISCPFEPSLLPGDASMVYFSRAVRRGGFGRVCTTT